MNNPYAPPTAHDAAPVVDERDRADLFIDSLPPPILKGAALAWFVMGLAVAFFLLHIVTDLVLTAVVIGVAIVHGLLALACFGVAAGLLRGKKSLAWLGFVLAPVLFIASGFALYTGALAGLMAMALVLLAPALTAAAWSSIGKVGRARELLAAG